MTREQSKFWAGAILYNPKTKSVLLHHRDKDTEVNPDMWGFFGGVNEADETPLQTLVREIKEELAVDISNYQIIPFLDYFNSHRGLWRYVFKIEFDLNKNQMTLGEGQGFNWVPVNEVLGLNLTDKTRQDFEIFIKSL